jgi:uncharacterized protein (TIGR01777 family)
MNIGITGATGFIGRRLTQRLQEQSHSIRAISVRTPPQPHELDHCDAVIHLAGEPVDQRWTAAAKQRIVESRVNSTRALIEAMRSQPPKVLINASAVGYYGSRGDEVLTEDTSPGSDFLSSVCVAWEREAVEGEKLGVRVVRLRIGIALGAAGGALARMLPPFRLGLGGRIGSGRQWMSWVHIDDLCNLAEFALREEGVKGAINATSPNPVTNAEFTRALSRTLHRPAVLPIQPAALKLLFGEMSEVLLLASQRVIPQAAVRAGFAFQHADIREALRNVLAP